MFDPSLLAPGRKETLSLRFVYCRRKLPTWVFVRLEWSHVGKLPAEITSGLGGLEGGLSIPLPGQDNDGF